MCIRDSNQDERNPWPVENQVAAIYAGTGGYLDRIKVERVREFLEFLLERLHAEKGDLMKKIAEGEWEDSTEEALGKAIGEAIDDFGPDFDEEGNPLEEGESDRVKAREEGGDGDGANPIGGDLEGRKNGDDEESEGGDEERDEEEAGAPA